MSKVRIAVSALTLSAAAFVGLATSENYEPQAMVPTKGDRPTLGFGSTFHADGRPVKMGETTTPVRALVLAQAHISKEEQIFRDSLAGASLQQAEFDVYMDWIYQYGTGAWRTSGMRDRILEADYRGACRALLEYRFMTSTQVLPGWEPFKRDAAGRATRWRFDCSTPGNRQCMGVWTRQKARHDACMEAQ